MKQFKSLFKKLVVSAVMFSAIALAGLSVATYSSSIVANAQIPTLGARVCGDGTDASVNAKCAFIQPGEATKGGIAAFILQIARFITYIAGAIAVIMIVIAGVQRMNSTDADAAKNSNTNITNAAVGLAIAILAYTIVGVLSVFLIGNFF